MNIINFFNILANTAMLATAETAETSENLNEAISQFGPGEYLFTGAGLLVIFLVFAAPLFLAVIPAKIAQRKGRNFAGYYVFGYFALIPAIIVINVLKPVEMKPEKKRSMSDIAGGRR